MINLDINSFSLIWIVNFKFAEGLWQSTKIRSIHWILLISIECFFYLSRLQSIGNFIFQRYSKARVTHDIFAHSIAIKDNVIKKNIFYPIFFSCVNWKFFFVKHFSTNVLKRFWNATIMFGQKKYLIIVIMKVLHSLVLSLLLSAILSLSKVKLRQRINGQRSPGSFNCNVNYQPKYTLVLNSLTLWKVSTNLRYNISLSFYCNIVCQNVMALMKYPFLTQTFRRRHRELLSAFQLPENGRHMESSEVDWRIWKMSLKKIYLH
jgi:hypothetical protein